MNKMKKILAVGLASVLAVSFAACSNGGDAADDTTTTTGAAEAAAAKTGYSIISSIADVEDTTLTIDSVCAAVLVDADGKIIDVKIDEAQTKPDLATDDGNVADLRTKLEKKEDYGMKGVSPIGAEWYEQIAAFEDFAKGKTAAEITAAVGEDGYPSDADLKAGCTIHVSDIATAVANAVNNAQDLGASATDTLKLDINTEKYYESDETNLQYDSNYAIVTLDADGKITSCIIDASQAKCSMDGGKFTVEAGSYKSKKELGDDYGMKAISPIGAEWYEQAASFEKFAIGKTAAEITAAVGEDGYASDADLKAGCTIIVSSIAQTVADAATVA
ncbi:MAG: hypothetical protein PUE08_08365 [Eubacteriales bacterium]|nr:hypothetical protein [Eubacteriales bacterium]